MALVTGQDLVDEAELLTGRTSESTKMLSRINIIQRKLWRSYEWDFAIDSRTLETDALLDASQYTLSLTAFNSTPALISNGIVFGTNANDQARKSVGNWVYSVTDDRFLKLGELAGGLGRLQGQSAGTTTSPFQGRWFRIDYSLENWAINNITMATATRRNYGRFISARVEGDDSDLEIVTPNEWLKRVPQMDIAAVGRPKFATVTTNWVDLVKLNGVTAAQEKGTVLRVWPIPDASYPIHYSFHTTPENITLTSTPIPNDGQWHAALTFGAAWLTRLDDIDSTAREFKTEYEDAVSDLTMTYKVTPNVVEIARGPRQLSQGVASDRIRPFSR